jgi:glycosyltransferase involved in cell wall biosynthesis
VITSNISSLPELGGDAALLVEPGSVAELHAALERMLSSPDLRAQLSANGLKRASQFQWEVCAQRSWQFFERIHGKL